MLQLDHFVQARAAFCRDIVARRADRFGKAIHGPAFDDESLLRIEPEDPPAPPVVFHIIYQDAKGDLSGRVFTLRNARKEITDIRLTGFCHWRAAVRSFIASRVVEATDLATGEVSEDGIEYFGRHPLLQGLTADTNLSLETLAMQECRDEVIVLSFVGAADGLFDEAEREAVVKHVMDRCPDEGLNESVIRRRVNSFVPDERSFHRALDRLCAGQGDARHLMRSLKRVVDADGDADMDEIAFVHEIEGRLTNASQLIS